MVWFLGVYAANGGICRLRKKPDLHWPLPQPACASPEPRGRLSLLGIPVSLGGGYGSSHPRETTSPPTGSDGASTSRPLSHGQGHTAPLQVPPPPSTTWCERAWATVGASGPVTGSARVNKSLTHTLTAWSIAQEKMLDLLSIDMKIIASGLPKQLFRESKVLINRQKQQREDNLASLPGHLVHAGHSATTPGPLRGGFVRWHVPQGRPGDP